jgi:hypothetical protein
LYIVKKIHFSDNVSFPAPPSNWKEFSKHRRNVDKDYHSGPLTYYYEEGIMISFCKSGMLVLQDREGMLHFFDSAESISDVAKYVWKNTSLDCYQANIDDLQPRISKRVFVEFNKVDNPRLRGRASRFDDPYCQEPL